MIFLIWLQSDNEHKSSLRNKNKYGNKYGKICNININLNTNF